MKLLACNSNKILSQEIAKYLGVELVNADVKKFTDNEIFVEIKENVRGQDVFVLPRELPRLFLILVMLVKIAKSLHAPQFRQN